MPLYEVLKQLRQLRTSLQQDLARVEKAIEAISSSRPDLHQTFSNEETLGVHEYKALGGVNDKIIFALKRLGPSDAPTIVKFLFMLGETGDTSDWVGKIEGALVKMTNERILIADERTMPVIYHIMRK